MVPVRIVVLLSPLVAILRGLAAISTRPRALLRVWLPSLETVFPETLASRPVGFAVPLSIKSFNYHP